MIATVNTIVEYVVFVARVCLFIYILHEKCILYVTLTFRESVHKYLLQYFLFRILFLFAC